jgi:ethanolamine utilization cobalamin adenosyltransferase
VDGRVLSEVVSEDYLRTHVMDRTDQIQLTQTPSAVMTPEEKEMLESHLRALGYF